VIKVFREKTLTVGGEKIGMFRWGLELFLSSRNRESTAGSRSGHSNEERNFLDLSSERKRQGEGSRGVSGVDSLESEQGCTKCPNPIRCVTNMGHKRRQGRDAAGEEFKQEKWLPLLAWKVKRKTRAKKSTSTKMIFPNTKRNKMNYSGGGKEAGFFGLLFGGVLTGKRSGKWGTAHESRCGPGGGGGQKPITFKGILT